MKIIKKSETKPSKDEIRFMPSGKIINCDSIHESSYNAEGDEHISHRFGCDSSFVYEIKKDMMHISKNDSRHWYYKVITLKNGLEFNSIYSDEFNKK